MSLRRLKFTNYNRMEAKEEGFYWMDLMCEELHYSWYDDEWEAWGHDDWYNYFGSGWISNMGEYHQMKLLTLLRKLNIGTAKDLAKSNGW